MMVESSKYQFKEKKDKSTGVGEINFAPKKAMSLNLSSLDLSNKYTVSLDGSKSVEKLIFEDEKPFHDCELEEPQEKLTTNSEKVVDSRVNINNFSIEPIKILHLSEIKSENDENFGNEENNKNSKDDENVENDENNENAENFENVENFENDENFENSYLSIIKKLNEIYEMLDVIFE